MTMLRRVIIWTQIFHALLADLFEQVPNQSRLERIDDLVAV